MSRHSILVVDDDEQVGDVLSLVLENEGYDVSVASSAEAALGSCESGDYSLILLDLRLGETDGLSLLPRLRELQPNAVIFMITGHGDVDSAVSAFTLGAKGYIKKPFEEGDLKLRISQALDRAKLHREVARARNAPGLAKRVSEIIRTQDPAMEPLLKKIETAAQVMSNVVITGESGTGKELVARALHQCGPRSSAPFVAFNCAALPETLIESELFGYARGAFTDARADKPGLFQRASGGTLFIDEIGDAPASVQAKLLRVLQEREVFPLGARAAVRVDVRVVAATHRSLQEEVALGRFRADLYYRLHVVPIAIPALRDRPKDILLLSTLFASRLAEGMGIAFEGFTPAAIQALERHGWPGNVRELQNRVEHALALGGGGWVSARSLFPEKRELSGAENDQAPPTEETAEPEVPTFCEAKNSFERSYLVKVLSAAKGNIAKAARLASKSRTEVYSLIRKHDLDPGRFKGAGSDPRDG